MIKKLFLQVLGAAVGLTGGALLGGLLHLQGPVAVGTMAAGVLFGATLSAKIAKKTYEETEDAVHGHPIRTFFLWLFILVVIGGALVLFAMAVQG